MVMAPFIWIEARTLSAYGIWQWANLWNVLDSCTYVLQVNGLPSGWHYVQHALSSCTCSVMSGCCHMVGPASGNCYICLNSSRLGSMIAQHCCMFLAPIGLGYRLPMHICYWLCMLQILITVAHLQRSMFGTHWMSVVLATQCLLLWAKMQYYSRQVLANAPFIGKCHPPICCSYGSAMFACTCTCAAHKMPRALTCIVGSMLAVLGRC